MFWYVVHTSTNIEQIFSLFHLLSSAALYRSSDVELWSKVSEDNGAEINRAIWNAVDFAAFQMCMRFILRLAN